METEFYGRERLTAEHKFMLVPLHQQPKFNQKNFRISVLYQLEVLISRQLMGDHILSLYPWLILDPWFFSYFPWCCVANKFGVGHLILDPSIKLSLKVNIKVKLRFWIWPHAFTLIECWKDSLVLIEDLCCCPCCLSGW